MKIIVLTLFPDMIRQAASHSVIGRAIEKGLIELETIDIRDYSENNYHSVDDYPFGGGAGMVMQVKPVYEACKEARSRVSEGSPLIYMSPCGRRFDQSIVKELAQEKEIILLCGHYEGIDQRVLDEMVTDEISIGDYVLTGGELASLVILDAVSRLVPGVLGNTESAEEESFSGNWLEYPQYSRPREFHGKEVPEVLLSGNHAKIKEWRLEKAIENTMKKRPDMIDETKMTKEESRIYHRLLQKNSLHESE